MKKIWSTVKDIFWLAVAGAIVGGGFFGYQIMGALKEPVAATPVERVVPLVSVTDLQPHAGPLPIRGEGFIKAFREVDLAPETPGRIVDLHPAVDALGSFSKGDVLLRLDDRTTRAALDRATSDLAATRARLSLNETQLSRGQTLLTRGVISQDRLDQLLSQNAELTASLEALRAAALSAEIALQNMQVIALFDGAVLSQSAELGAVISAGQPVARLFTSHRLEVTVPVSESDAALVPGLFTGAPAKGTVTARFAGRDIQWAAEVTRVDPALDGRTRTVGVTLMLKDQLPASAPYDTLPSGTPPALLNSFVEVTMDGIMKRDIYRVPSTSVRDGGTLWLTANDHLTIQPVDIVHVDAEATYVRILNQAAPARLVTSALDAPANGMAVRVIATPAQTAALEK